ncbi:aminotransferase class I/II-fold pyridoxal phosphate-dependent enzyme [Nocardia gipuzkoensis]
MAETTAAVDSVSEVVIATAMRHTHYRRDQLDPTADLEGELGIDSVVLIAIIGDAAKQLALPANLTSDISVTTLGALIRELETYADCAATDAAPPDSRTFAEPELELAIGEVDPIGPAGITAWDGRSMRDFLVSDERDLFAKAAEFAAHRRDREAERLYWYGMPLRSRCTNRARIYDEISGRTREFLMFGSNNYLGLANHPQIIDAICAATREFGATNTGCRIIGGTNHLHKELERRLAAFKGRGAAIVYPGGYAANLGAISALVGAKDAVIVDKLNHMSIVDGWKLSSGLRRIYRHNDMAHLESVLDRCAEQARGMLIVTDGVFSMHGDICELPQIVRLARSYGARVLVDDAHATGVLGARGTGTAEHYGLKGEVDLELGTMSKTLAGMGGFVVGDEEVIDYLRFYSNSYVFAATIPAGVAAGLIASIDVMEREPERITLLWNNIRSLTGYLTDAGFDLERTRSAILPIVVGDERQAMEMGRAVRARGLFCQTVVFPGVPLGEARLRVSVTSEHTPEDLDLAAQIFIDAGRETGVLP